MKNGQDILSYLLFYATMFSGLSGELKDLARLFIHYNIDELLTKYVQEAGILEGMNGLDKGLDMVVGKED